MTVALPDGWQVLPLEHLLVGPRELTYGIVQPGSHRQDGVPIVRVGDIRDGVIDASDPLRVDPAVEEKYRRSRISGGELLMTLVGTVGECAVASPALRGWNVARAVAVIRVVPEVGARWVARALRQRDATTRIEARLNTTVQATLNLADLRQLPVVLPPPADREAIAGLADALDDKIESNRRTVDVALRLARAQVDAATDGCGLGPYSEWLTVLMGSAFRGADFAAPGVGRPLLRIRDLKTFQSQTWTTEHRSDEVVIHPGDIVVGMDAEFRATLWLGEDSVLNQRVCSFAGRGEVGRAFILAALEPQLAFQEGAKSGTTVIHLNKADIDTFRVPRMSGEEHHLLAAATEPLIDLVVAKSQETRKVAALRDALLPELLSGRLRVPEAAEAVAGASA